MTSSLFSANLVTESFEGLDMVGYTITGTTNITLTAFDQQAADYLLRTSNASAGVNGGNPLTDTPYIGFAGNFIAMEDIDPSSDAGPLDAAFPIDAGYLTLDPVVGAYENMTIGFTIAASEDGATSYEVDDGLELQYRIDGGTWTTASDTNYRGNKTTPGIFNGPNNIRATATSVSQDLTGLSSTSSIQVRVYFQSGVQEAIAFDDIFIDGDAVPEPSVSMMALLGGVFGLTLRKRKS
ncbi:MAG: PEP-CTERM sorting domain-containing protein [Akkermansiaceae bacterium]